MKIAGFIITSVLLLTAFAPLSNGATAEATCSMTMWTEACFDNLADGQHLKTKYLKRVKFQRNGFAVLQLNAKESVAINRKGKVVIPGIISGEFDYTEAEDGIAKFYVKHTEKSDSSSKCGYFQLSNFKIVIPPVYNICARFHRQKAYVCVECKLDCSDCHNYAYYGAGEAFVINRKNEILKRFTLPKIPRCSTVKENGGFPKNQPCRPD